MSNQDMSVTTAIVVGLGCRGRTYSQWAIDFPNELRIVAVADPRPAALSYAKNHLSVVPERLYHDWTDIVALGQRLADFAIICTQDSAHRAPTEALAQLGYHILLEKPMATSAADCASIVSVCHAAGVKLAVCHVLRYLPVVRVIHKLLKEGIIGQLVNIQHREDVGNWHFAHSFVRGNWRNEAESSFSLLAKCCHDVDLICFWMQEACVSVSSFGGVTHFKSDNAPEGAGSRCCQCDAEKNCVYSAKKIYLDSNIGARWPCSVLVDPESVDIEDYNKELKHAVEHGPYGRCVYACDNDVCDQQVVNMQFESGATATLTMMAFTGTIRRESRLFGSKGELHWIEDGGLFHYDFAAKTNRRVDVCAELSGDVELRGSSRLNGHRGADYFLMKSFMDSISKNNYSVTTSGENALQSHLICFAAEKSRKIKQIVRIQE